MAIRRRRIVLSSCRRWSSDLVGTWVEREHIRNSRIVLLVRRRLKRFLVVSVILCVSQVVVRTFGECVVRDNVSRLCSLNQRNSNSILQDLRRLSMLKQEILWLFSWMRRYFYLLRYSLQFAENIIHHIRIDLQMVFIILICLILGRNIRVRREYRRIIVFGVRNTEWVPLENQFFAECELGKN